MNKYQTIEATTPLLKGVEWLRSLVVGRDVTLLSTMSHQTANIEKNILKTQLDKKPR